MAQPHNPSVINDQLGSLSLQGTNGPSAPNTRPGQGVSHGYPGNPQATATHRYYPSVPSGAAAPQQTYAGMYSTSGSGDAAAPGYPQQSSDGSVAPSMGFPTSQVTSSNGTGSVAGQIPSQVGAGWTPESVQPTSAGAPGQYGHYGHLQYAPSFNTAAGTGHTAAMSAAAASAVHSASGAAPPAGPAAVSHHSAAGAAGSTVNSSSGGNFVMPQAVPSSQWVLQDKLPQPPTQQLIGPMVRFNGYDPSTGTYAVSVLVVSNSSLSNSTMQLHYAVNAPATQQAPAQVLDEFMGYRFWRFDIQLQLVDQPAVVNYLVGLVGGQAPLAAHSFQLPARSEPWRWIFYSCNGFHEDEPEHKYGGIAYMWKDVMQRHQQMRFHLQVGGGDQLYCDRVFLLPTLKPWLNIDDPHVRSKQPFTPAMLQEVEQYYFGHYAHHFSDPVFAPALANIPFTFSWDDHDIFDGWGSYPDYLQRSAVFQGMFAVARRFYLLFQQHCRYDNATFISNTMGEYSYHQVHNIGPNVLMILPDTRSERTIHQVLPPPAWDMLLHEVTRRLDARPGAIQHLLVLLPVPIVYPKIPVSESILSSMSGAMARSKPMRDAVGKLAGSTSGAVSVFNEPDLLDDLLDHWTSGDHVQERQMLVRRLQALANNYSIRVTFMSGDVHVGAFGCFQAHPKQHLRVIDPKYMLQVISSAIGNEPPPGGVISLLESTSMATTAMGDTLDKMIRAFPERKKLKGARNYCEIVPLLGAHTDTATGASQPPGGLAFTLRVEMGNPGAPTGIETCSQVAPVLLAGPRAAEGSQYAISQSHVAVGKASGVAGQIGAMIPGEAGQQLQQGMKTMGHKLANFLGRI